MERWIGKIAIVTGASAGIGVGICEALVNQGILVAGFARRVERVEELSKKLSGGKGKLHAVKCDVSDKQSVITSFKWVLDNLGPVSILVNNAGLFKCGTFADGNVDDWKTVMDTNVIGLAHCSHEAIKQMRRANIAGHIIHINSISGHTPIAGNPAVYNIYSPSKYAVTCMTEIMSREMTQMQTNIKITSISPGLVKSELGVAAKMLENTDIFYTMPHLKPEDIANAIIYALGTPPHVNVQELTILPVGRQVSV